MSLSSSRSPSPAKKSRSRVRREVNDPQESSDDEEKLRMVVKRMASAFGVEEVSCVSKKPKLPGEMGLGNSEK